MTEQKKILNRLFAIMPVLFLCLLLASCGIMGAGGGRDKMEKGLKESVDAFNFAFRWEEYTNASAFLPASRKADYWCLVDTFKGRLRIVDFEIREIEHQKGSLKGTAIVSYQYYLSAAPTLEKATFTQSWYFTEADKTWKVEKSGFDAIAKTDVGF